jgi:trimeric autotransporter adhesin
MKTKHILALPLILIALLCMAASAFAQTTPAGTQIRNRASATYEDLSGNTFASVSNEVITVVLPVYGVSILPDDSGETPPVTPAMSQNAIGGQTVVYSYTLTNTGNDNDSYSIEPLLDGVNSTVALALSAVSVYHDVNNNGVVDGGEPAISVGGVPGVLGPLAANASASLIVTYAVPGAAVAGEVAYVGVQGTSVGDGAQVDTRNYHLTTVVNDAVLTALLSAAPALVFDGDQITYTFSGTNTGANTANGVNVASVGLTGVLMYDLIPTNPASGNPLAIFGAPIGAPAGGTVLYLPSGSSTAGSPETWNWGTTTGAGDIAVGYVTSGGIVSGQAYGFSYQVTVPVGMTPGVLNNTASLAYVDNSGLTPDPTLATSNNAPVTVGTLADVLIGPSGNPGAGTPPNFDDDVQSVATAYANTTTSFTNTIRNDGNASDAINVLLDGSSTVPGSWTVVFYRADGVTPLSDSDFDGNNDVGPLAPGATIDIVVHVIIPGSQGAGGPFDAVVRAQSANIPTESNLTTDRILQVLPAGVDIGNFDGVAGTTDNAPLDLPGLPGAAVDFALDVINAGGSSDNFTLSATIPGGWTATFYLDANSNGVLDASELTPITATGPVAGGSEANVIARVDVPAGTLPGVNATSFTATSSVNGTQLDTIANTVTVNALASVDFAPDNVGNATAGGTLTYAHTVTNTGNVADTFDLTYASSQGWTYVFFDAFSTPITSVTLAPGANAAITVRLTIPVGTAVGTVEVGVLSATGQATLATDNATDVTTIVVGNLSLTKSVNPVGDQLPGTDLSYTVDYQNLGSDDITTIVIYDAIPAWTQFLVGSASTGTAPASISSITIEYSDDNGATWAYAPASGGGGAPAGYDANVTNVRWVFAGNLLAGGSSTAGVGFTVRIQ